MQWDANNYQPQQGFGAHQPGMWDFEIAKTAVQWNKNKDGMMLVVTFTSPGGQIDNRYNLWNKSPQATEIANKELSALAHATGRFRLTFNTDNNGVPIEGAPQAPELIGGRGRMEVAPQANNPDYMEIRKVFDSQGNEPGKPKQAQQPPQGQQGGWGTPQGQQQPQNQPQQPQGAPMTQQPNGGWGQQPQNAQPQQGNQPGNAGGGWQAPQQGTTTQAPPWGNRS